MPYAASVFPLFPIAFFLAINVVSKNVKRESWGSALDNKTNGLANESEKRRGARE
jgi:hypothetical protein